MKSAHICPEFSSLTILLASVLCALSTGVLQANDEQLLVYDNIYNTSGRFFSLDSEFGDEISLSGTARQFERFELEYFGEFSPTGDEKAVIRFYENDGTEHAPGAVAPGTLLYQSPAIGIKNGRNSFSIQAGNTGELSELILPDTFTWTIEVFGIDAEDQFGLMLSSPIHIGQSFRDFWAWNEEDSDFGPKLFADSTPANFSQRVYASGGEAGTPNAAPPVIKPFDFKLKSFNPANNNWHLVVDGTEKTNFIIEMSTDLTEGWQTLFSMRLGKQAQEIFFSQDFGSDVVFFRAIFENPELADFKVDRSNQEAGVVNLDIFGDLGLKVRVEWTQDLSDWRPLVNLTVQGDKATYSHKLPEDVTSAFYRVVVVR